jgi:hypothetical protein
MVVYVDKDQEELYSGLPATYVRLGKPGTNTFEMIRDGLPRFFIVIGPRYGPIHSINALCHALRHEPGLVRFFPSAYIFAYLTDDSTIGPVGWDEYVKWEISTFPKRIGVVSLNHGADYVNFYAVSKEMVDAVGYYAVPDVNHAWYWDTAMELIGDATRIVYSHPKDVFVTHSVQLTTDSQGMPDEDCRRFAHWCISDRKRAIKSVRAVMESPA